MSETKFIGLIAKWKCSDHGTQTPIERYKNITWSWHCPVCNKMMERHYMVPNKAAAE